MKDMSITKQKDNTRYGINRMKMMTKMKQQSELWLQQRDTPLQRLVAQTAEHHLERCEELFGISRYDQRLSSRRRS